VFASVKHVAYSTGARAGRNTANPQSLNRYAYVLNNPTTLTDPLGLDSIRPTGCAGAVDFWGCVHNNFGGGPSGLNSGGANCIVDGPATSCSTVLSLLGSGNPGAVSSAGGITTVNLVGPGIIGSVSDTEFSDQGDVVGMGISPVYGTVASAFTFSNAGGLIGDIGDFLGRVPWAGSINIPVPVPTPAGPAPGPAGPSIPFAFHVPGANKGCVGLGWWAGSPGAKTVGVGPLIFGNPGNATAILSGPSWSFNVQLTPFVGFQLIANSSGILAGPTAGLIPGFAVSQTTSTCNQREADIE
jgi:hypothetical protein